MDNINNINTNLSSTQTYTKDSMTQEEIISALNIPPHDENNFPIPSKEFQEKAGGFMLKLSILASSVDKNLQSLVWSMYMDMREFFLDKSESNEKAMNLALTLEKLKEYLSLTNNPIFND